MGGNFPDARSKVTGGINPFSSNSRWGCRRRRQKCRANGQSPFMAGLGTFRRRSDGIRGCERHSSDFGLYATREGLPDSVVFQIREGLKGDLLIATRSGVARMEVGKFLTYRPPDPLARTAVFDAIEDAQGALWLAAPGGLSVVRGKQIS